MANRYKSAALAVESNIEDRLGRTPSNDELWQFWRHFNVFHLEMNGERARDRNIAIQQVRNYLPTGAASRADDLFDVLQSIARELSSAAGTIDQRALRERRGSNPSPSANGRT